MSKRILWVALATLLFTFQFSIADASALNITKSNRTIKYDSSGKTIVLTNEQFADGRSTFINSCSKCHNSGRTKTNQFVTLSKKSMAGAYPPRDNLVAVAEFLKNPKTYDGEKDLSLFHPAKSTSYIWKEMRNLTDEKIDNVSGYILIQQNVLGIKWGGGKVYN